MANPYEPNDSEWHVPWKETFTFYRYNQYFASSDILFPGYPDIPQRASVASYG
jgi:hypothetical protein